MKEKIKIKLSELSEVDTSDTETIEKYKKLGIDLSSGEITLLNPEFVKNLRQTNIDASTKTEAIQKFVDSISVMPFISDEEKEKLDFDLLTDKIKELYETAQRTTELEEKLKNVQGVEDFDKRLNEEVNARISKVEDTWKSQIKAKEKALQEKENALNEYKQRIASFKVQEAVNELIRDENLSLNPKAAPAIISAFEKVYKYDESRDKLVPTDSNNGMLWNATGDDFLDPKEWVTDVLKKEADYLFLPSESAGIKGSETVGNSNAFSQNQIDFTKASAKDIWGQVPEI